MQSDLVSKSPHDIITVGLKTDVNGSTTEGKNPIGDWDFVFQFSRSPNDMDRRVWSNGIRDTIAC
jgi:hypothetical protein